MQSVGVPQKEIRVAFQDAVFPLLSLSLSLSFLKPDMQ